MSKKKQNARKLRREAGMNQTEFWNRIGVTQSGGSRYENGRTVPKPVAILMELVYAKNTADAVEQLLDIRQQRPRGAGAMSRGRKPATGRYDTRAELVAEVWRRWRDTPANVADIARAVRVSEGVVHRILNTKEGSA